jgi:hypothetical protein
MNDALKTWIPEFNEARLTLEVMGFTTKALSGVQHLLETDVAEKNFYASMFRNQVFIAGSRVVYDQFINVIQTYIDKKENNFLIAERTYNQFLADTDKGSIKVIEHLSYLKDVVDACGLPLLKYIEGDRYALEVLLTFTQLSDPQWQSMATIQNWKMEDFLKEGKLTDLPPPETEPTSLLHVAWITSPLVFYKLINSTRFLESELFVEDKTVIQKLKALHKKKVFPSLKIEGATDRADLLKRVAKVVKGLADKEVLDFSMKNDLTVDEEEKRKDKPPHPRFAVNAYYQCGSSLSILKPGPEDKNIEVSLASAEPFVGKRISWRFNIKYVGCRLSDWFDSVPLAEYQKWNRKRTAEGTYDYAKGIAGFVNGFALSLQTTIYMVSVFRLQPKIDPDRLEPRANTVVAKAATHETIDILYSRVTREGFMEIMVMSADKGSLVDIRVFITALMKGLARYRASKAVQSVIYEGGAIVKDINKLVIEKDFALKNGSKRFFDALFQLVKETAEGLVPK